MAKGFIRSVLLGQALTIICIYFCVNYLVSYAIIHPLDTFLTLYHARADENALFVSGQLDICAREDGEDSIRWINDLINEVVATHPPLTLLREKAREALANQQLGTNFIVSSFKHIST